MSFPFEITTLDPATKEETRSAFKAEREGYVQVGPEKYFLSSRYPSQAEGYYNMELRPDDVWVVTYPRCGTTWTQEMVWLVNNDLDYDKASKRLLIDRYQFLEVSMLLYKELVHEMIEESNYNSKCKETLGVMSTPGYQLATQMASPRHFKTHLPLSLLPPKLIDTCKVVYVARNPKDAAVSNYYHSRHYRTIDFKGDFKKYWDLFQRDLTLWSPFWIHAEEAWQQRDHPNLLFLFYEDMKKDLGGVVRKVSTFFNKNLSEDQISGLCDHLDIKNFKKNPAMQSLPTEVQKIEVDSEEDFIRKGMAGKWREHFNPELNTKADKWIKEQEKRTDIRFQF